MKNFICFLLFAVSVFSVQDLNAQATNNTLETWVINYYGATTTILPGAVNVPINIGVNCLAGISVRSLTTPGCGVGIAAPGLFAVGCSPLTGFVAFNGTPGLPVFCTVGFVAYANPFFLFG